MVEKKLTNKELIRFRRSQVVKDLALHEVHERTHTGTHVMRKLHLGAGGDVPPPNPTPSTSELREAVLQTLVLAGDESISITLACARVAQRHGLTHAQVPALKDEVLHYLEKVATEIRQEGGNI